MVLEELGHHCTLYCTFRLAQPGLMVLTLSGPPARIIMGAVLALLASTLGARGARAADCAARHGSRPGIAHFDLLTKASSLSRFEGYRSSIPISPCAGLRCSAGDPSPPSPSVPVSTLRSERWGTVLVPPTTAASGVSHLEFNELTLHSAEAGLNLFRPPRAR